jgi:ankyrin repeat protein
VSAAEEQRKACLDSLSFCQIDVRLLNIKTAHDSTCDWLFEQPEYKKWLNGDLTEEYHGFLWIKGKPAAGKSTIMKHALLKTRELLAGAAIISFFFNARGNVLEKTTLGMYRSLLHQLLTAIPHLQDVIVPMFLLRRKYNDDYEWNIEGLQEAFITTIKGLQHHRLVCFIDALDECEENDVRKMVEFLEDLGNTAVSSKLSLNICLSSRHYPHISIRHGLQLTVERQDGHKNDIAKYVESKFKAPCSRQTGEIKAEILTRASGVFLWVVLVVQMLNKAYDHGQIHALRSRLREIPSELDDLFADILLRDDETREESVLCLQWLLFAQRPLQQKELYFAVLSGTTPFELVECDPIQTDYVTIDRFILSCSKGLAEVSRVDYKTVQFIHESVRDFFLFRNGLAKLQPDLAVDVAGLSHERLKICCLQYIMTDVVKEHLRNNDYSPKRRELRKTFPFLEYAVHYIFWHADVAQGCGISQRDFLGEFRSLDNGKRKLWITLENILSRGSDSYTSEAELLYILSEASLSNLVHILLLDGVDVDAEGERYRTAIQAAAAHGNEKIVRLLLDAGANVNIKGGEYGHTLNAAIHAGNDAIVQMLLENGAHPNCKGKDGWTPLGLAAYYGRDAAVRLLLGKGADINLNYECIGTPLSLAARNGHEAIVRLLLENHADPFSKDGEGWYCRTPLSWAAELGNEAILRLLLVNPNADHSYMIRDIHVALPRAINNGHRDVVQLLEKAMKIRKAMKVAPKPIQLWVPP